MVPIFPLGPHLPESHSQSPHHCFQLAHLHPSLFFKIYLTDYGITVVPFFLPFIPLCSVPHLPPSFPNLSSCLWVICISSMASSFIIPFLTSLCVFCAYQLCFLFPVSFPPFSPFHLPADNPPCDLYFCESVPVLIVCLVHFCVCFCFLGSVVDSYKFVVILLFIFLIFFLDKSL